MPFEGPPYGPGVSITGDIILNGAWNVRRYSNDFENGKERLLLDRSRNVLVQSEHSAPRAKVGPAGTQAPPSGASDSRIFQTDTTQHRKVNGPPRLNHPDFNNHNGVGARAERRESEGGISPRGTSQLSPRGVDGSAIVVNIRQADATQAMNTTNEPSGKRKSGHSRQTDIPTEHETLNRVAGRVTESDGDDYGRQSPTKRPRLSGHFGSSHFPSVSPSHENDFAEDEFDDRSSLRRPSSPFGDDTEANTLQPATDMTEILEAAGGSESSGDRSAERDTKEALHLEGFRADRASAKDGKLPIGRLRSQRRPSGGIPDLSVDISELW
ncbi:hypothetical protein CLAFUW4_00835 [Fulvia fulva]|uniref:Uncharacterized protein n=1 Tax=Passalora fulva TaxID=5499 RepID=A0A9Q8L776_PASFU|nr:uncharacterized protein CLAFUR5_00838 [Fulvia fulva]KAK4635270.1 hypothetical protein CLAFUR4_00836 [Fulvia fulva]KAK4638084.1 hypothetical protein CLAFUR0_00836 [Fulvia fulva]UJO12186.1 hypothetical protein CLAFUR5_00838 [Fulvia fulva]WPV09006.1 hypothetical protein CLAFUW4_00835 [Fulvia fulva]WPV23086.1 hypothetical protein CLAFUW7_00981 [Fulvia fulva]